MQTFSKYLSTQLVFKIGITRSFDEVGKLLSEMCVVIGVTSVVVDMTLNFSTDDVWLSEDDGVDEVVVTVSVILDESTTIYDILFKTIGNSVSFITITS